MYLVFFNGEKPQVVCTAQGHSQRLVVHEERSICDRARVFLTMHLLDCSVCGLTLKS